MNIVTRALWNAANPTRITPFNLPAREVYVHHGASAFPAELGDRDGDGVPDGEEALVREYQQFHFGKGWSDIAYNWLISPTGRIYEGRGWDRVGGGTGSPEDSWSMSICALGNYEQREPTAAMVQAYIDLIVAGIRAGKLTADVTIKGDRDVNSTACPGKHLYAMLDDIRAGVRAALTEPEDIEMASRDDLERLRARYNDGNRDAVRFVQGLLDEAARLTSDPELNPGNVDGRLGPRTRRALVAAGVQGDVERIGPKGWGMLLALGFGHTCPPRQTGSQVIDELTAQVAQLTADLELSRNTAQRRLTVINKAGELLAEAP